MEGYGKRVSLGQPHNQWGRPKLTIPNSEPATPRRRTANGQSPRGMHGFPPSPESPGDSNMVSSPVRGSMQSGTPLWARDVKDQGPPGYSAQTSPSSIHSRQSFTEFVGDGGERFSRTHAARPLDYIFGDYVLVRCNQTKWLVGQVRRSSSDGIRVWIGAAQTLVNVPVELFSTHLARLDSPTPPPSPTSTHLSFNSGTAGANGLTRVQCVRPAHLSHRQLYQQLGQGSPNGMNSTTLQVQPARLSNMTSMDQITPKPVSTRDHHAIFHSSGEDNPSDYVSTISAERGQLPRPRSILKRSSTVFGAPVTVKEDEEPVARPAAGKQPETYSQQVQYTWRPQFMPHFQQLPLSGEGTDELQGGCNELPINIESSSGAGTVFTGGGGTHTHLHRPSTSGGSREEDSAKCDMGLSGERNLGPLLQSSLIQPARVKKWNTAHDSMEDEAMGSQPTASAYYYGKDRTISEDKTNFKQLEPGASCEVSNTAPCHVENANKIESQLPRSVSLDSAMKNAPTSLEPGTPWSLGCRLFKPLTSSTEHVWVTVIETGHDNKKGISRISA